MSMFHAAMSASEIGLPNLASTLVALCAIGADVDRLDLAVARPREALDFLDPRFDAHAAGRPRDHRLALHDEAELAPLAVRHRIGVARGFATGIPCLIADLDAAQPLHADVAFPARNEKAQRIALLRAQHLAV